MRNAKNGWALYNWRKWTKYKMPTMTKSTHFISSLTTEYGFYAPPLLRTGNNGCTPLRHRKDDKFIFPHFVWWALWTKAKSNNFSWKRLLIHRLRNVRIQRQYRRKRMWWKWRKFGNAHRVNRYTLRCGPNARDVWRVTLTVEHSRDIVQYDHNMNNIVCLWPIDVHTHCTIDPVTIHHVFWEWLGITNRRSILHDLSVISSHLMPRHSFLLWNFSFLILIDISRLTKEPFINYHVRIRTKIIIVIILFIIIIIMITVLILSPIFFIIVLLLFVVCVFVPFCALL